MHGKGWKRNWTRRAESVILSCALVVSSLFVSGAQRADAAEAVTYLDYDESTGEFTSKSTTAYTVVTSVTATTDILWGSAAGAAGNSLYVVDNDVTMEGRIVVQGDVGLILCDGCKLEVKKGIYVPAGTSFTIYGQSGQSGTLVASGTTGSAGIGGEALSLTNGETYAASCGNITINGGKITSTGNTGGAGIGGGSMSGIGLNNIGKITINGGDIIAEGAADGGAGIGTGVSSLPATSTGEIVINGEAIVEATGGNNGGAGIGGGQNTDGCKVTIKKGYVEATGSKAAGIGGGYNGVCGDVLIEGGKVKAACNQGAGIGGFSCTSNKTNIGSVTIKGGRVRATGGLRSAGIGSEYCQYPIVKDVSITGGVIVATGQDGAEAIGNGCNINGVAGGNSIAGTVSKNNCILNGIVYGDAEIEEDLDSFPDLSVPSGCSLTIDKSCWLTLSGNLEVEGTVNSSGCIILDGNVTGSGSVYCKIGLDTDNDSESKSVTAVYGNAMPDVEVPVRAGYTFGGFFTEEGGKGIQYYDANGKSLKTLDKDGLKLKGLYISLTFHDL